MVWTACVAVYFSFTRGVYAHDSMGEQAGVEVFWLFYGLGSGTALGGLLLWVARRHRGLPFPSQPGEWIWVIRGTAAAIPLPGFLLVTLAGPENMGAMGWFMGFQFLTFVIAIVLSVIAAVRVKARRWRVCLIVLAVASLPCCFPLSRPLTVPVLLIVVLQDVRRGVRRRWTHWLGVAVEFWEGAATLAWLAALFFFYPSF